MYACPAEAQSAYVEICGQLFDILKTKALAAAFCA